MLVPLIEVPATLTPEWLIVALLVPALTTLCGLIYKLMERALTKSEEREAATAKLNSDLVAGLNGLTNGFKELATEQRLLREAFNASTQEFRQAQRDVLDELRQSQRRQAARGGD